LTALVTLLLIGFLIGALALELTGIFALALSAAIGVIALIFEALSGRAESRRETVAALWPEVLDFTISAISSGASITECLLDLAEEGPLLLRPQFQAFKADVDRGHALSRSLEELKTRLGHVHADRLIEILRLVSEAGGSGLIESLRNQVQQVRAEVGFNGEISAKLGWITGTAKVAVGAPWLIVAMLSTRPENALAYASAEGSAILLFGLTVSAFAFRLIKIFGMRPTSPRVFA
jgi:tight adherence protein B